MLKQHIELVGKVIKPKEIKTAKGWIYSFSIPITDMDGEQQITQWLNCSIFLKGRDPRIMQHTGEFHIVGKLVVKKAWGDNPQSLGLFGFEITPVLGKVYKQGKPKETIPQPKPNMQEPPQGGGEYIDGNGLRQTTQAPNAPQHTQQPQNLDYQSDFPIAEEEIPFMYIGKRLSHAI